MLDTDTLRLESHVPRFSLLRLTVRDQDYTCKTINFLSSYFFTSGLLGMEEALWTRLFGHGAFNVLYEVLQVWMQHVQQQVMTLLVLVLVLV